jgi:NADPH-dependent 2,4-dienoyl-CoA reductase/sulfur reductase-like enzyme
VADIALVTDEPHLMYYRPRLPGYVGGHVRLDSILERDRSWARSRRIELFQPARVVALDAEAHTVTLADGRTIGYAKLLIATGARPRRLGVPGGSHRCLSSGASRTRAHPRTPAAGASRGGDRQRHLRRAGRGAPPHQIGVTYIARDPLVLSCDEATGALAEAELW